MRNQFLLGVLAGTVISGLIVIAMTPTVEFLNADPIELTQQERESDEIVTPLQPMTATLQFLDREDYNKLRDDAKGSSGFTIIGSKPCQIFLSTDSGEIVSRPREGFAEWRTRKGTNALEHELLHCLRGYWHPSWDQIAKDRAAAAAKLTFANSVESFASSGTLWQYSAAPMNFSVVQHNAPVLEIEGDGKVDCLTGLTEAGILQTARNIGAGTSAMFIAIWRAYCPVRFVPSSTFERVLP